MFDAISRDYKKIKALDDYKHLDEPSPVDLPDIQCPYDRQYVLRMLVRPKYSRGFFIPPSVGWLMETIEQASWMDRYITGIKDSWCYVTVRHGFVESKTDDEWHFDGVSFRTSLIPERNYVYISSGPIQFKTGSLVFPDGFDPVKYNLFTYAAKHLSNEKIQETASSGWYLINPFCLHRRNPSTEGTYRTFVRISFTDIEGRDVNNTENVLLKTPAYGRDPVRDFRNNLKDWE